MTRHPRHPHRAAALLTALLAGALLTACAAPLPVPQPDAVPVTAPPAVSVEQMDRVLAAVSATLAEADAVPSAELLAPRVTGPAATTRGAQYVLRVAGDEDAITAIPGEAQTLVVPTTDIWPRTVMVITAAPEDLRAPLLLTLVQDDPRADYTLTAWARLFPGVQVPATAQPEIGSPPVAMDTIGDTGVALSPDDVLAQYVDLLTNGDASAFAAGFTADPLRTAIVGQRDGWAAAVTDKGTLTETYQVAPEHGPWSISTADGGAIVVGAIQTVSSLTLTDSTLTIGDATAALLGSTTVASNLTVTWLSMVAFAVPPAGSDAQVQVLGAEHSPVQVTGQ